AERMNLVAQDEIWKYRLRAESEARQNWPAKWGYLTTPMDKHIKILPSPPVPKTTQGFIGWRSGKPALYCLEKYSEVCSCKGAYAREL
ncbi:UNVERIFIED_CONTAM: hypothetical protein FQV15_0000484, partial [Eudyptes pachyrhynchus]